MGQFASYFSSYKWPYCERNPEKKFLLVTRLARTDDNGVRTVDTCLENKRKGVLILEISLLLLSRPAIKVATVFCLCFVLFCFFFLVRTLVIMIMTAAYI